jgi:preprotein translocase subunit YajC
MLYLTQSVLASAPQGGQPGPFGGQFFIFIIAMIAIMYFLVIRPNQTRERERKNMLASLEKGEKVITAGGIIGTIVGSDETKVVLRVSEEPVLKLEVLRGSIARVLRTEQEEAAKKGKKK